jgi:anion-transporting  ArsA/GET3 family ATPase
MSNTVNSKPIEIFCGTGGVGKTTLATGRALHLARKGKKVLLITIDPARRLKQVLGLEDKLIGHIHQIDGSIFGESDISFSALLMSPKSTLARMAQNSDNKSELDNPIVNILTRPYGGMNEIMAIIEVQHQLAQKQFDTIILDTPPGKHFIDFLQSSEKIKQFFDKSFVDIFKFMGKKFNRDDDGGKQGLISLIVSSGVKKLLKYLEKVTGADFVEDFIDAISGLYLNRQSFLDALEFQESLKNEAFSNWFLVTSVEQFKQEEALELQEEAKQFMHKDSFLLINKSLTPFINNWTPDSANHELIRLRQSMKDKESTIKQLSENIGHKAEIFFPEVLGALPQDHVKELADNWE